MPLAVALTDAFAPVRSALVDVEPAVAPLLFLAALAGWLGQLATRRRPTAARRLRRLEGRLGRLLGASSFVLGPLLFLLPLWSGWELQPTGGSAAYAALFGRIPHSDALGHYEGAVQLLTLGHFGDFSARRPLNACWLAVRLVLTGGSLSGALVLQSVLLGLAVAAAGRVVGRRYGLWTALVFVALTYGLTRDFAATTATEPLGVTLAVLGIGLAASLPARRDLRVFAAALFLVDLSLQVRPGAQFLGPFLALWGVWCLRGRRRAAALAAAAVLLASTLFTATLNRVHGDADASFASYPAFTLYGLASGQNYLQARADFGPQLDALPDEHSRARFLYARAAERVLREPGILLSTLAANEGRFLEKLPGNANRPLTPGALFTDSMLRVRGPGPWDRALGFPLLALALAASAARFRHFRGHERAFWLAGLGGLAASAPVVYGDGGFRVLAATYPLLALALGAGLSRRRLHDFSPAAQAGARRLAGVGTGLAAALCAAALVVPLLTRSFIPRPDPGQLVGLDPATEGVIRIDGLSPAVVVWNSPPGDLGVPVLNRRQFQRHLDLAMTVTADQLAQLDPPFALVCAWDHLGRSERIFALDPAALAERGAFLRLRQTTDGRIARVSHWEVLPGPVLH